jgi:hypothetical protein
VAFSGPHGATHSLRACANQRQTTSRSTIGPPIEELANPNWRVAFVTRISAGTVSGKMKRLEDRTLKHCKS